LILARTQSVPPSLVLFRHGMTEFSIQVSAGGNRPVLLTPLDLAKKISVPASTISLRMKQMQKRGKRALSRLEW